MIPKPRSAAAFICTLHKHVLIQPLGGFQGQASDILIHAAEMKRTRHTAIGPYAEHCGRSHEEHDNRLSGTRAVNLDFSWLTEKYRKRLLVKAG